MTDLMPPAPSVEHLTTIFRRISKGDIRIPAFQRRLVWTEGQVISLLESVYRGFPIGSILLWSVRTEVLREARFEYDLFPITQPSFPTHYVLDGLQRLSSLYGVFQFDPLTSDPRLDIMFNVKDKIFLHAATMDLLDKSYCIPVSALLDPREMLRHQAQLLRLPSGDELVDRLIELQSSFQDYMVPIVTISRTDIPAVVEIFERINNTGTRLDTVDFMRAVTWSNDFDLNGRLDEVNDALEEINFSLSEQALIKLLGIELGKEPLPDDLLTLRDENSARLNAAVSTLFDRLCLVAEFFKTKLQVYSSEYVPYEGQLLVIYKAVKAANNNLDELPEALISWYWAVGFNESLRGKPDHYVARAVRSIDDLLAGKVRGVEPRLDLKTVNLLERRFIQGKALSASIAGLFAHAGAKSLFSGDSIPVETYMTEFSGFHFQSILSRADIEASLEQAHPSSKIIANVFLADNLTPLKNEGLVEFLNGQRPKEEALASQFLDEECVNMIRATRFKEFLERRADLMIAAAAELIEGA